MVVRGKETVRLTVACVAVVGPKRMAVGGGTVECTANGRCQNSVAGRVVQSARSARRVGTRVGSGSAHRVGSGLTKKTLQCFKVERKRSRLAFVATVGCSLGRLGFVLRLKVVVIRKARRVCIGRRLLSLRLDCVAQQLTPDTVFVAQDTLSRNFAPIQCFHTTTRFGSVRQQMCRRKHSIHCVRSSVSVRSSGKTVDRKPVRHDRRRRWRRWHRSIGRRRRVVCNRTLE